MSTHSMIAIEKPDGTVVGVYNHSDGYLYHTGRMLLDHYNTVDKVEALIAGGFISYLQPSIECPEGHTFRPGVPGYTIFYARDRGDDLRKDVWASFQEFDNEDHYTYEYIMRDGLWYTRDDNDGKWYVLTPGMCSRKES